MTGQLAGAALFGVLSAVFLLGGLQAGVFERWFSRSVTAQYKLFRGWSPHLLRKISEEEFVKIARRMLTAFGVVSLVGCLASLGAILV